MNAKKRGAQSSRNLGATPFWSLDDLYTAISQDKLESILQEEIIPGDNDNRAWRRVKFCCEKAKDVVLDMLNDSYSESDFAQNVPAIVRECISVLSAIYLVTEGDNSGYTEKLKSRYADSKEMLLQMRDFRLKPKMANGSTRNNAVYFGSGDKEL